MLRLLIILASALITILCYYPHYLNGWLMLFALVPVFYILVTSNNIIHSAAYMGLWGFVVYGAGLTPILVLHPLTWLGIPMFLSGVTLLLAWIVFTLYFTAFLAIVVAIIHFYRQRVLLLMLLVPVAWVIVEYLHSLGAFGLTINSIALTQLDTPFSYFASIGGIGLVSFSVITVNMAIAVFILLFYTRLYENNIRYNPSGKGFLIWSSVAVAIGMLVFAFSYSMYYADMQLKSAKTEKEVSITALQADIVQEVKWSKETAKNIVDQLHGLAASVPDGTILAVTPETALPMGILGDQELITQYTALAASKRTNYLIGSAELDNGYKNRATLITSKGINGHYDKDKLVAFGEYTPFREFIPDFLSKFVLGYDDFISGGHKQEPVLIPNTNIKIANMICLESVYLDEPLYQVGRGANIIAVMTNDGWYKGSTAVHRHMEMAQYDALAYHRSVIFVSNRGPSAIISANGKMAMSKPLVDTVLNGKAHISDIKTIYMMGGYLFDIIMLLVLVFVLLYRYISEYAQSTFVIVKRAGYSLFSIFGSIGSKMRRNNLHSNQWNRKNNIFSGISDFFANLKPGSKFKTKIKTNKWKNKR